MIGEVSHYLWRIPKQPHWRWVTAGFLVFALAAAVLLGLGSGSSEISQTEGAAKRALSGGTAAFTAGKFDKALLELRKATNLSPRSTQANFLLAQTYEAQGQLTNAAEAYADTIALDGAHLQARYKLALIQQRLGDVPAAVTQAEQVVSLDSSFAAGHLLLARLYASTGESAKARTEYEAFMKLAPAGSSSSNAESEMSKLSSP